MLHDKRRSFFMSITYYWWKGYKMVFVLLGVLMCYRDPLMSTSSSSWGRGQCVCDFDHNNVICRVTAAIAIPKMMFVTIHIHGSQQHAVLFSSFDTCSTNFVGPYVRPFLCTTSSSYQWHNKCYNLLPSPRGLRLIVCLFWPQSLVSLIVCLFWPQSRHGVHGAVAGRYWSRALAHAWLEHAAVHCALAVKGVRRKVSAADAATASGCEGLVAAAPREPSHVVGITSASWCQRSDFCAAGSGWT